MTWTPPETREVATNDRVLRYCVYGRPDGTPVVSLHGTPGTRWERPDVVAAINDSGLRVLVPGRPGYGSTRHRGRSVADVADDVRRLADAEGWDRFAVTGFSGGAPHALACAALLPDRVTRCSSVAGIGPLDELDLDWAADARQGEQHLRTHLARRATELLATLDDQPSAEPGEVTGAGDRATVGGESGVGDRAGAGGESGVGRSRVDGVDGSGVDRSTVEDHGADSGGIRADGNGRRRRLHASLVDGLDGWIDDDLALVRPWGFDVAAIKVPVSVWYGSDDDNSTIDHAQWLLANVPGALPRPYAGGHDPSDAVQRAIFDELTGDDPRGRRRTRD